MRSVRMRKLSAGPAGVFPVGSVRQVDADTAAHLVETGQADPADASGRPQPQPSAPEPEPVEPEGESDEGWQESYPKHKGAGWYELSDGATVRGEAEANAAEAALHEE